MNISPIVGYISPTTKRSRKKDFISYTNELDSITIRKNSPTFCSAKNTYVTRLKHNLNFWGTSSIAENKIQALYNLTSGEKAQEFIARILEKPAQSQQKVRELLSGFDLNNKEGLKAFKAWGLAPNGYYGAYETFVTNSFKNAKSIEELLKFQPNWSPWMLERKTLLLENAKLNLATEHEQETILHNQYTTKREIPFHIGELPQAFSSPQAYEELVVRLKAGDNRNSINIGDTNYNIHRLKGGDFNDKFIYSIKANEKTFILKFDRINVEDASTIDGRELSLHEKRTIRKNKYLAADSIYLNACVSKYLELNDCNVMPKLLYYDHKTNSSLFEYVDDINHDNFQNNLPIGELFDLNKMNSVYKQLNILGIYLNDASRTNILVTQEGKEKIIDLGHCTFMDPLKPGIKKYNMDLSNSNGPAIGPYLASLLESFLG